MGEVFDYQRAFSRNIGWLSNDEQESLRGKKIAIAGLGGVGGAHLLTLTRLGVGSFHIADFDTFEQENFNRQVGASMKHIGREKVAVMRELASDINPELDIRCFERGIDLENIDTFLDGVDLYVDSLDFFSVDIRRAVFAACTQKGIPAITAAPLGMGAAFLSFMPGKMTFEDYFRLDGLNEQDQLLRFLVGLSPAMLQKSYLVDEQSINFAEHRGPSTPMACDLCAGIAASNALKILLQRGRVVAAPRGLNFDAYANKLSRTWRPWGNNNWFQRLIIKMVTRKFNKAQQHTQQHALQNAQQNTQQDEKNIPVTQASH